ncbi:uncharacterized protein MYCFIDRAFT_94518, partial [Pseudocercospora fijiensis CIRAD86]
AAAGRQQGAFKLNDDVVDFLKPSTEKSKPKIDIAIAKRWPDAHEVRRAGEGSPLPHGAAFTKPRRRKGLTVSFVKTVPEIIGEGGDEAQDPPREISRMKAAVSRSVSDRMPGAIGDWPRSPPLAETQRRLPPPAQRDDFVPQPIRRTHTSGNEFSPAIQRKMPSPPSDDHDPYKPSLGRVSTGFDHLDVSKSTQLDTPVTPQDRSDEIMTGAQQRQPDLHPPRQRPAQIDTHLENYKPQQGSATAAGSLSGVKDYSQPSPTSATRSPVAEKRRQMSTSEGMVLRRASMMIAEDDDSEASDEQPTSSTSQAPRLAPQPSNISSISTSVPEVFSPPDSSLSPETAATPDAPNPFADPKHMKRHSREVSPGESRRPNDPAQSLRQQRPTRDDRCAPTMWLRAGLWWYLVGKSGLESLLQQQRNSSDRRELLTQAHVDLAKAWWILTDPLESYESHDGSPLSASSGESTDARMMVGGVSALKAHLRTLALSMSKNRILPPEQSLIQVMRGRQDFPTSISIASQSELVNVRILARQGERRNLTWSDVTWKASAFGMLIHLPRNFDLSVRMQERDFRAVWNLSEYARKVEKCLRPEEGEVTIHEARLAELQYADSSNPNAFAPEKVRGCTARVFERQIQHVDGSGIHKVHRGYRLLLVTDPGHKTLSAVSHEVGTRTPFYFEYLTDPTAQGTTAMVIRIREEKRQCRALLVFPDAETRQALYEVLTGLSVGPDETIVGRMSLTSLRIEPASQTAGFSQSAHTALQQLQWQKLGVTNSRLEDPNSRIASTVQSDKLRIVARHSLGCITDRLNLGKGELLLRVPTSESASVQILREPQQDMTMSIDTRNSPQHVSDGVGQLLHAVMQQPTIRTFTFASREDLHTFQTAITGYTVRYDGLASSFGISRRRMVVPIYKKLEASNVRLQIVYKESVVQLLAFMEEFNYADAMCFQIKSTDVFEQSKGDSKGKKWSVKMVDAKFSLPPREKDDSEEIRLKQRYVNLEGLDYAEEHDDITIGFDSEQDRDRFAQALPAATSVHRGITLKRR